MTTKTTPIHHYTPAAAARLLAATLGESETKWLNRLENWRRGTKPRVLQWTKSESGRPVYESQNVRDYIEFQKQVQQGILASDNHKRARVAAAMSGTGQTAFVRIAWNSGDAAGQIDLSPTSAQALVRNLQAALTRIDIESAPEQPAASQAD